MEGPSSGLSLKGGKKPSRRQHERTFTGTPSASRSWDLLYFKRWRLAVGGLPGLFLRAFLNKKKLGGLLKDSPGC